MERSSRKALGLDLEMLCPGREGSTEQQLQHSESNGEVRASQSKGPLMNEAMTNCWPLEKEIGASTASQNSFVYKACK